MYGDRDEHFLEGLDDFQFDLLQGERTLDESERGRRGRGEKHLTEFWAKRAFEGKS